MKNRKARKSNAREEHLDRRLDRIEEMLKLLMANQLTNELSEVMETFVEASAAPNEDANLSQTKGKEPRCPQTVISSTPHIVEVLVPEYVPNGAQFWLRPDMKNGSYVEKGAIIGVLRFSRNVKIDIIAPADGELNFFRIIEFDSCFSVKPGEIIAKIRCC